MKLQRAALAALLTALTAWANPAPSQAAAERARVLVGFKDGTTQEQRTQALAKLGGRAVASLKTQGKTDSEFEMLVMDVPPAAARPMSLELDGLDDVLVIEEDVRVKWIESNVSFQGAPLPSLGAVMDELPRLTLKAASKIDKSAMLGEIPWGVRAVRAHALWDVTEGQGTVVAVIDTGVRFDHADLEGQVIGEYSAITDSRRDGAAEDENGHGTHVAGTIAAKRNGFGVVGVAPKAKILAIKVLDKDGSGTLSDVIKGIVFAAENGAHVANMSLGAPFPSDMMRRALRYAKARGVVVVAAAGNSGGSVGYPAAYPETIAVAANDSDDNLAPFSSRGPEVKFTAPGVDIVSTWLTGDYHSISGTSMAAPHVAGLAALAVSRGARGLTGPDGVLSKLTRASACLVKAPEEGKPDRCYPAIDARRLGQL